MHKTSVPSFIPPSLFSLTKISNPSASITAEFSTLHDGSPQGSCSMTVPTFNHDGLYFTPSFYLPYDKVPCPNLENAEEESGGILVCA